MNTLKGIPVAERFLKRREEFFQNLNKLTESEIELLSKKWHKIANRYQSVVAKLQIKYNLKFLKSQA